MPDAEYSTDRLRKWSEKIVFGGMKQLYQTKGIQKEEELSLTQIVFFEGTHENRWIE